MHYSQNLFDKEAIQKWALFNFSHDLLPKVYLFLCKEYIALFGNVILQSGLKKLWKIHVGDFCKNRSKNFRP